MYVSCLPGLNQYMYLAEYQVSCSRTQHNTYGESRVHTGKFELKSRIFQGLLNTILQFSRTKSL